MGLILLNLQSNQEIYLDKDNPFVIGRGSVTGCADKRVSRSHGRITCTTDGKINLMALHSNPCFFTRKGTPPVMQLNKNEEEVLNEGDCLGLLPNSFWYQITSQSKLKDNELKNSDVNSSQMIVPNTELIPKVEVKDEQENNDKSPTLKRPAPSDMESNTPRKDVCRELPVPSCSGENTNIIIPLELRNTCKLPLYMYEIKGQKNFTKSPIKKYTNNTVTKSPDLTKVKKSPGTESTLSELAAGIPSNNHKSPDKKNDCQDESKDGANTSKYKPGRPYCQYDAQCYRKNAQHKLEYSHPGDEDYVPYCDRPLCEYGANCYRRNLNHRRQFRHVGCGDPQTSQASDPDSAASVSSTAAGSTSGSGGSCNSSSTVNGEQATGRRRKRKHRFDNDRSPTACRLSVTVSTSPTQKRRRNSQTGGVNLTSFYSSDFDDPLSSSDPFSDDCSSDDYLPSDDSGDDFDEFDYYGKDYFRDYYF